MAVNFTFIGLLAPVFTIFNPDFSLNTGRIPGYANYLQESGINGVVICATTGEGPSLSLDERKSMIDAWASAVKDTRQHLMVQVGGAPFPDVIELARYAEHARVDSILTLPELFFKPKTINELVSYLKYVSAAAPNTPLFYYHNPGLNDIKINMADFLEQAQGIIPNFKGIKFTTNDVAAVFGAHKAANGQYTVFIGGDYSIEPAFAMGISSAIAGSMNVFPRYSVGMLEAVKESKIGLAIELQNNLTRVMNTIKKYGSPIPGMKLAMNLFTPINVGLARPPLQNPSPYKIEEFKKALDPFL